METLIQFYGRQHQLFTFLHMTKVLGEDHCLPAHSKLFFNVLFLFLVMIYLSLLKKCSSFRRLSLCLGKTIQESIQEEYWCHRVLNIKCWEVTLFSLFSDKVALDKWSENNTSTELLLNWCLTQLIFSVWYLLFRDIIFIKICCLFIPLTNHWIWWIHWLSLGCRWEK